MKRLTLLTLLLCSSATFAMEDDARRSPDPEKMERGQLNLEGSKDDGASILAEIRALTLPSPQKGEATVKKRDIKEEGDYETGGSNSEKETSFPKEHLEIWQLVFRYLEKGVKRIEKGNIKVEDWFVCAKEEKQKKEFEASSLALQEYFESIAQETDIEAAFKLLSFLDFLDTDPDLEKVTLSAFNSVYCCEDKDISHFPQDIFAFLQVKIIKLLSKKDKDAKYWRNVQQLMRLVPRMLSSISLRELSWWDSKITECGPEIGQLTGLTDLDLSFNKIPHLPSEVGQLTGLVKLNLSSNGLTEIPPEISLLTRLQKLNLDLNPLQKLPNGLLQLRKLKKLELADPDDDDCLLEYVPEGLENLPELDDESRRAIIRLREKLAVPSSSAEEDA